MFVGPNGHGKTNLLESLNYLSTLSSHRVSSDAPMIRAGAAKAFVGSAVVNHGRELIIDVELLEEIGPRLRPGDAHDLDVKVQRGAARDCLAGAGRAVAHLGRNHELRLGTLAQPYQTLVPSGDHLADADLGVKDAAWYA